MKLYHVYYYMLYNLVPRWYPLSCTQRVGSAVQFTEVTFFVRPCMHCSTVIVYL